jgi:hypothetical protein
MIVLRLLKQLKPKFVEAVNQFPEFLCLEEALSMEDTAPSPSHFSTPQTQDMSNSTAVSL